MSADTALAPGDEYVEAPTRRRWWRRLGWLVPALVSFLSLCVAAAVVVWGEPSPPAGGEEPRPEATATVERTTLEREEELDGTLGYAGSGSFFARSEGVVTWLPEVGAELSAGDRAWEIDGAPTVLLRGDKPAYRLLQPGSRGEDVRQFEQALAELGYGGFTVDGEYTLLTAEAVRRWQRDTAGMEVTGTVDPARIWYVSGPVRVTGHEAAVGGSAAPGTVLLGTSSTRQVVRIDLEVGDRGLVTEEDEVTVRFPGGESSTGEVVSVGTVAEAGEDDGGTGTESDPTVEVVVELTGDDVDFLDRAPVTVEVRGESREDVLTAPVGALLALSGGGYGLSVVDGDGTVREVPVETGWFTDGLVEVSGDGIDEGTEVVVPE